MRVPNSKDCDVTESGVTVLVTVRRFEIPACVEPRHSDFRSLDSFVDLHSVGGPADTCAGAKARQLLLSKSADRKITHSVLPFAAPPLSALLQQGLVQKGLRQQNRALRAQPADVVFRPRL